MVEPFQQWWRNEMSNSGTRYPSSAHHQPCQHVPLGRNNALPECTSSIRRQSKELRGRNPSLGHKSMYLAGYSPPPWLRFGMSSSHCKKGPILPSLYGMQTTNTKWPNEEEGKQEQPPNHKSPLLPGSNSCQSIIYHLWQRYQLNDPTCSKFAVWDLTSALLNFKIPCLVCLTWDKRSQTLAQGCIFQVARLQWHMLILVCSNFWYYISAINILMKTLYLEEMTQYHLHKKSLKYETSSAVDVFLPFPTFIVAANNSDKVSGKRLVSQTYNS